MHYDPTDQQAQQHASSSCQRNHTTSTLIEDEILDTLSTSSHDFHLMKRRKCDDPTHENEQRDYQGLQQIYQNQEHPTAANKMRRIKKR